MLPRLSFLVLAITFASTSFAQTANVPISAGERLRLLLRDNLGPTALLENIAISGATTLSNSPKEYGTHWDGFGERVGMVTANRGVTSVMETGLESIWGEDPRYDRTEGQPFQQRFGHVVKMTFFARNSAGNTMPAYARFLAIPGSSFLSNTWRPDSESSNGDAVVHAGLGFLSHMAANAYKEFRPRR